MSKENEQVQEQQAQNPKVEAAVPEFPVLLTGMSREEVMKKFDDLKAQHKGANLSTGAVGRIYATGTYVLLTDILN